MRKGFIYGAALVVALAANRSALAKPSQASPDGEIKGTYNCQLSGGFIAQAGSSALAQFSVDEGDVTDTAGELNVSLGAYSIPNPNNTSADFVFPGQYSYEACNYTPSGGTYTLNGNGGGTISIKWTASADNASSPTDCTEDITTNFNILVNSSSSFTLNSTDLLPGDDCGNPDVNFANCGQSLSGSCQQQSVKS
jgi:hypothetical protein